MTPAVAIPRRGMRGLMFINALLWNVTNLASTKPLEAF